MNRQHIGLYEKTGNNYYMLDNPYLWFKALHIIAFTAWMAGLFYLPRLYVYHASATPGGELATTLQTMERRLLRVIMNPAMILTFIFGFCLLTYHDMATSGWLHAKLFIVLLLACFHGFLAVSRKKFERGENTRSEKFYRLINEFPTLCLIAIVLLAVLKPF